MKNNGWNIINMTDDLPEINVRVMVFTHNQNRLLTHLKKEWDSSHNCWRIFWAGLEEEYMSYVLAWKAIDFPEVLTTYVPNDMFATFGLKMNKEGRYIL